MDLTRIAEIRKHLEFNRGGMMPVETVINEIVEPMMQALGKVGRWISLREAIDRTGRSEAFFRARLDCFQGKSRLERWESQGMARLEGTWMISPAILPPPKPTLPSRSKRGARSKSNPDPAQELRGLIQSTRSR
jgi:hypothetical protein